DDVRPTYAALVAGGGRGAAPFSRAHVRDAHSAQRAAERGAQLWEARAGVRADVARGRSVRRPRTRSNKARGAAVTMKRPSEHGLGRGLGALIPPPTAGLREVPVGSITPNPWQPRTSLDQAELEELAQSIREHGVLQPILVSQQADGTFQLITGERRLRAVQLTGLATLPALVKEATPQASLEMALVENIQRRDLNPLEEAHAFRQLLDEHGLTQEQLANRIGKSRVAVTNTLRLLHLPDAVRQALADGSITEGHARAILTAVDDERRLRLLKRVVDDQLSV